jgi:hypothetical protein
MTLLSTIVAFLAWWVLGCSMVSRGPLSTLIPSVWNLKEIGVRNHLPLWGNQSLCSRLRHRLKTLSYGVKDRFNMWRIDVDAGSRVGALLTLVLLRACLTVFPSYSRAQEPCLPWSKNSRSLRLSKHKQVHHLVHWWNTLTSSHRCPHHWEHSGKATWNEWHTRSSSWILASDPGTP